MKLKRLIIARHGEYGMMGGKLLDEGRMQVEKLAGIIKKIVGDDESIILTSTAPRAVESAEILSKSLGIPSTEHEVLWSDEMHDEDLEEVYSIIGQHEGQVETLILVTHFEYSEDLPCYYETRRFGTSTFEHRATQKGYAWYIDCVKKTANIIG